MALVCIRAIPTCNGYRCTRCEKGGNVLLSVVVDEGLLSAGSCVADAGWNPSLRERRLCSVSVQCRHPGLGDLGVLIGLDARYAHRADDLAVDNHRHAAFQ